MSAMERRPDIARSHRYVS